MADLEALLFDVDGTLADTERDGHRVAFNAAFADAGLGWQWDEALYGRLLAVTGGKERIRYYLDRFNTGFVRPAGFEAFVADLHRAKTDHYTRMLAEGRIPLRTGVMRLLEEARARDLRLAVATTTTPENVTALLRSGLGEAGIGWFEVIAAGDIVPAKKPAPDIYLWAMEKMALAPGQCLALEDSHNGVQAVTRAGIKALVVTVNAYTRNEDLTGAALVVDHLGDADHPCFALAGDLGENHMIDVDLLKALHRHSNGA